jgi:hypothetical protein
MPPGLAVRLQSVCSPSAVISFITASWHSMAWYIQAPGTGSGSHRAHIRLISVSHQAPRSESGESPLRRVAAAAHRKTAAQDGSAAQDKRQERKPDNDNDNMTSTRACGGTVDVDVDTRNDTPGSGSDAGNSQATVRMSGTGRRRGSGHIRDLSDRTGWRSANREMAVCDVFDCPMNKASPRWV